MKNNDKNTPIPQSLSFTRDDFKKIANDFLTQTEKDDKDKMAWETRNHVPTLYQSLNEFYMWLDKNYWC